MSRWKDALKGSKVCSVVNDVRRSEWLYPPELPHSPSQPTMQLLHLIFLTIALPDTLPAPTTYLVDDVCRALYSPQSVSHGMP